MSHSLSPFQFPGPSDPALRGQQQPMGWHARYQEDTEQFSLGTGGGVPVLMRSDPDLIQETQKRLLSHNIRLAYHHLIIVSTVSIRARSGNECARDSIEINSEISDGFSRFLKISFFLQFKIGGFYGAK